MGRYSYYDDDDDYDSDYDDDDDYDSDDDDSDDDIGGKSSADTLADANYDVINLKVYCYNENVRWY